MAGGAGTRELYRPRRPLRAPGPGGAGASGWPRSGRARAALAFVGRRGGGLAARLGRRRRCSRPRLARAPAAARGGGESVDGRPSGAGGARPGRRRAAPPAGRGLGAALRAGRGAGRAAGGAGARGGGPWAVARLLRRCRRALPARRRLGWPAMAVALADALGGGRSLRGRCRIRARRLGGAAGYELRRAAAELAAGAPHGGCARGRSAPRGLAARGHARGRVRASAPGRGRPRAAAARQRPGDGGSGACST